MRLLPGCWAKLGELHASASSTLSLAKSASFLASTQSPAKTNPFRNLDATSLHQVQQNAP